jgi:hypothetical protein
MYNVTPRRIHSTTVFMEKQLVLHIMNTCLYLMRMRHTAICGLSGSTIFFHMLYEL